MRKKHMKRALFFIMSSIFLFSLNSVKISAAFSPFLTVDREMELVGIIPYTKSDLMLKRSEVEVEFIEKNAHQIYHDTEHIAKVSYLFEIYNPSEQKEINFTMPFLSRFFHLNQPLELKVNHEAIDIKLFSSPDYAFFRNSFAKNLDQLFQTTLIGDYELEEELDGFLYTIHNPATRGKDYYASTTLTYKNVSNATKFFDCFPYKKHEESELFYSNRMFRSGEIDYLFITEDIEVDGASFEYYNDKGHYKDVGHRLDDVVITKEPIKFSEYLDLEFNHTSTYEGLYQELLYHTFLYLVDEEIKKESSYDYPTMCSPSEILLDAINDYRHFSLNFNVPFEEQKTSTIEITFNLPVYCRGKEYSFAYYPNLDNQWESVEDIRFKISNDEMMLYSSIPFDAQGKLYQVQLTEVPENRISITFENSYFRRFGCSCLGLSVSIIYNFVAITMLTFIIRKRKN